MPPPFQLVADARLKYSADAVCRACTALLARSLDVCCIGKDGVLRLQVSGHPDAGAKTRHFQ